MFYEDSSVVGLVPSAMRISDLCGDSLGLGVVVLVGAVSDSPSRWLDRRTVHRAGWHGRGRRCEGHDLRSGR